MAMKMNTVKFIGVNLFSFMGNVVEKHVKYYQSDFKIDKETLVEAVFSKEQNNKTFVWLCRESGTWCLNERNVFIRDTMENNTCRFYIEQTNENILAFIIEVESRSKGNIFGNVYVLDYPEYYKKVCSKALIPETIVFKYEKGIYIEKADHKFNFFADRGLGKMLSYQYQPHSQEELTALLYCERKEREKFIPCDIKKYMALI